jgi:thioredoxin 1
MIDERVDVREITSEDEFDRRVNAEGVHVVSFTAAWCRKCKTLTGKMEYFAVEHLSVTFDKVDVNAVPQEFIKSQGVTKMPTVKIFSKGKVVWEKVGFETVREIITELDDELKSIKGESGTVE